MIIKPKWAKRKLESKVRKTKAKCIQDKQEKQDDLYRQVKAGEVCGLCYKPTDMCACGVNDDWREEDFSLDAKDTNQKETLNGF